MANGRLPLSIEGEEKLHRIMSELGISLDRRPEALRLAFAKGITASGDLPEKKETKSNFTIGEGAVARGDDYILFKSLIVERVGKQLDQKSIDDYMLRYIELGIEIMSKEIDSLSELDNYLLYLVERV